MKTHELKIWPEYFEAVKEGRKTFEVRENDRHFKEGDTVVLKEFCPPTNDHRYGRDMCNKYTGNELTFRIGYVFILTDLYKQHAIFSLLPLEEE